MFINVVSPIRFIVDGKYIVAWLLKVKTLFEVWYEKAKVSNIDVYPSGITSIFKFVIVVWLKNNDIEPLPPFTTVSGTPLELFEGNTNLVILFKSVDVKLVKVSEYPFISLFSIVNQSVVVSQLT